MAMKRLNIEWAELKKSSESTEGKHPYMGGPEDEKDLYNWNITVYGPV